MNFKDNRQMALSGKELNNFVFLSIYRSKTEQKIYKIWLKSVQVFLKDLFIFMSESQIL